MHQLTGTALARSLRRLAAPLALALCGLALCYGLALGREGRAPAVYDYLHGEEEAASGEVYRWAPPRLRVFAPLALTAPGALVEHRLTAGPDPGATRELTVRSAGVATRFALAGGTPARVYSYLLPTGGHALAAEYTIAPYAPRDDDEERELGFVVYEAPGAGIWPARPSPWPALPLLAIACAAPLGLLVLRLWGLRGQGWLAGGALLALAAGLYLAAPDDALVPSLAIGRGLLVLLACGAAARLALARGRPAGLLLAVCVAAVSLQLVFVANGLWLNMGTQWYGLEPALLALLLAPPALALALAHLRAGRLVPLGAGLAALCVGAVGAWNLWDELTARPYDFTLYYEAAQRLRQGLPVYELGRLDEAPFDVYKYHPSFLAFILPLARQPLERAALLWRAVNLAALLAGGLLIVRGYGRDRRTLGALLLVLLLGLSPITQSLRLGQIDGLLLLGLALALAGPAAGRPWLAGPLWSLMALVKVYPAALALPELLRGRWRLAVAGAAGAVAIVLLSGALFGWGPEAAFWREVVPSLGARTTRLSNQSLYGLVGRTLDPGSIDSDNRATELPLAAALHAPLALLALGATGWAVWRRRGVAGLEERLAAASAVACAVLLAIPVSWDHYQALLLLPLLAACAVALREPGRGPWLIGALTLLSFGTYKHVQNGLIDSDVVLLLASYRTLGLALLWAWWLRWLWGRPGREDL